MEKILFNIVWYNESKAGRHQLYHDSVGHNGLQIEISLSSIFWDEIAKIIQLSGTWYSLIGISALYEIMQKIYGYMTNKYLVSPSNNNTKLNWMQEKFATLHEHYYSHQSEYIKLYTAQQRKTRHFVQVQVFYENSFKTLNNQLN